MRLTLSTLLRPIGLAAIAVALAGCATRTEMQMVRDEDTYNVWSSRIQHLPFVVHQPDGRFEAYDGTGAPFPKAAAMVEAEHDDRVEIYIGRFDGPDKTLC
ncbi:hypothetical protein [Luteibacter sp. 22Crub2.1]|uniref:hypothetical protein n=1 Tax=Luteibacter sp. 22Crub2.1 TaxID=1283288 RepID=UPI0009A837D9|nr:hypothetical protein [Luteibacter sp. 22Crub2.1]SKB30842.1 hypothetical protein SAMN05660880_00487 [Luteibacter sp. 22Crub2.1]